MNRPPRPAASHLIRSPATRVIHLVLLLVVLHQLVGSQFIERPFPGDPPAWPYSLHEYVGLASVLVVLSFWVWTVVRRGETRLGRLLPWLSRGRLRDVGSDLGAQLRRMAGGRPPSDEDGALASAVHGLGLLVVTAMALTGAVYYFTQGSEVAHTLLGLHKLVAKLMWGYLVAHAGLAVLHALLGSDILSRMFWPGRAHPAPPAGRRA